MAFHIFSFLKYSFTLKKTILFSREQCVIGLEPAPMQNQSTLSITLFQRSRRCRTIPLPYPGSSEWIFKNSRKNKKQLCIQPKREKKIVTRHNVNVRSFIHEIQAISHPRVQSKVTLNTLHPHLTHEPAAHVCVLAATILIQNLGSTNEKNNKE